MRSDWLKKNEKSFHFFLYVEHFYGSFCVCVFGFDCAHAQEFQIYERVHLCAMHSRTWGTSIKREDDFI